MKNITCIFLLHAILSYFAQPENYVNEVIIYTLSNLVNMSPSDSSTALKNHAVI
jgi:hypothetical protein